MHQLVCSYNIPSNSSIKKYWSLWLGCSKKFRPFSIKFVILSIQHLTPVPIHGTFGIYGGMHAYMQAICKQYASIYASNDHYAICVFSRKKCSNNFWHYFCIWVVEQCSIFDASLHVNIIRPAWANWW